MTARRAPARAVSPGTDDAPELHLIGGPYVTVRGRRLELPEGSRRLIALVALHGGPVQRRVAAGTLWPIGDDARATGNLRSALWRLKSGGFDLVVADQRSLHMREDATVDVQVVSDWSVRLLEGRPREEDLRAAAWRCCSAELLPGWQEEWVVFQRERLRQRSLHGLEALSRVLVRAGRYMEAVDVALTTVAIDRLRETAQRALVEALLAAGDLPAARRCYETYRSMLALELGLRPREDLTALLEAHTGSVAQAGPQPDRVTATDPCASAARRMRLPEQGARRVPSAV